MGVGTSFKRLEQRTGYDIIVIGSGIGSMAFASIMAKEGKKVLMLEKHYVVGGFTRVFKRKEYEWDVGIHYLGDMHVPYTFMSMLMDYVTDCGIEWQEMDDIYDRVVIEDRVYDFKKGKENFVNMLYDKFPGEEDAIDEYVRRVERSSKLGKNFFKERAMPPLLSKLIGSFFTREYLETATRTTKEVLDELTDNQELKAVLSAQYGDYGLPPSESSFAMQAVVNKHYWRGGCFPVGGCEEFANQIVPIIEQNGGKVAVRAGVQKIVVENGKATGVLMEDGTTISAPMIVSGAGYLNTMGRLLEPSVQQEIGFSVEKAIKPSVSHVCLYIGLKHNLRDLGVNSTNYWVYSSNDHDKTVNDYLGDREKPFPITYISFPSVKDPKWEERYPGKSTIEMITLAPYEWFQKWEDERWNHRGEEYEELKEYFSQRLLKELYKQLPQLEGKIDYYELSTPLSTSHFVSYEKGEIYGLDHSPERFKSKDLRPRTPVKNLWLTGQDIVTCGIGGALMGGLLTAAAVTGKIFLTDKVKDRALKMRKEKEVAA